MSKIDFYFKSNYYKNTKTQDKSFLGSFLLLNFLNQNTSLKIQKVFFNKFVMLKSPFHYKVSKKRLYNKQCIVILSFKKNINFNYIYFIKFYSIYNTKMNLFKISVKNKFKCFFTLFLQLVFFCFIQM